jgi:hypothetical protein
MGTTDFTTFDWLGQNVAGYQHQPNVQSGNNRVYQLTK